MNTPAIEEHKRRVAILRELAGKHPTWYIAEKIGTTDKAVGTLAVRYGISLAYTYRFWSEEDLATMVQMRRDGHKFSGIALVMGRSEQNCANRYRRIPVEDR